MTHTRKRICLKDTDIIHKDTCVRLGGIHYYKQTKNAISQKLKARANALYGYAFRRATRRQRRPGLSVGREEGFYETSPGREQATAK